MGEFISNHYGIILTITIFLIFALIGFIVDTTREKTDFLSKNENEFDEEALENLVVPEGKTINETLVNRKTINPETKQVELSDTEILNNNEEKI